MKLQLDENTFNTYLNEAVKRELNEAGWIKLGTKGAQKAASKAAGKTSARVITHSPITKKFFGNIKDAKSARKFIMGLKRGKVVSGTVEGGKGAKGLQWFTKDGKKFFTDAACTNQITDPKKLGAVTRSFNGHYTAAANLFNSAQRNMLGTSLVAGMGAGWAIDHAKNRHQDDPWNNGEDDADNENDEGEETNPWDGAFPWDDTEPVWTPKPTRTAPKPVQQPTAPQQPQRQPIEPIQAVQPPVNMPTGVTGPEQTIKLREPQTSFLGNASQAMVNAASTSPATASQREQNRAIRQTYRNARGVMNRDDYGPTAKQDKQTLKRVKNAVLKGDQHPSLEEGMLKLTEAQLNAYINQALNEELNEFWGLSRAEKNNKWGYQWDDNLTASQNKAQRNLNKANIKAAGYRNAQEYEAGEGHAYGKPQQQMPPADDYEEQASGMDFIPGQPAPFANEKYKVGQFQTWFNQNAGGKLVVDGIWGPKTQAAWDQWVNSN